MQKELFALFCVCLAAAMGEILLPEGAKSGTKRVFHFLITLAVLVLILTPFLRLLGDHSSFLKGEIEWEQQEITDYDDIFENAVNKQSETDLREGLYGLLAREYGIKEEHCQIVIHFDTDGSLRRVSLFLSGAALTQNPKTLEKDLSQRLCCIVEVR